MGLQRLVIPPEQWSDPSAPLVLTPEQRHYLGRVLRLANGDRLLILNGRGRAWLAELTGPEQVTVLRVVAEDEGTERSLTLLCALPKQGFDEVVRQCTELGVTRIRPVISERTLLRPAPQKLERWRRIMAEAAEQSERLHLPELLDPLDWGTAMAEVTASDLRGFCWARAEAPLLNRWLEAAAPDLPLTLAVGPEGGWSDREVEQALDLGWQPIRLGSQVLRAVTAAPVAIALARSV
jgi:16S rRNA (uracil1498-N3)-methyltransferase